MSATKAFADIEIGEQATLVRVITADDVRRFAELTGDANKLHTDRAFAEASPYKDIVVHGMLGASLLSTLIGTELPGNGAVWVTQAFDFVHPIRVNDTLTVAATVTKKHDRERLLELDAQIANQDQVIVVSGKGTVRVLEPPSQPIEASTARPKVAIVSGGAGGIGRSTCRALSRDGYAIVLCYRSHADRADEVAAEIEGSGGSCHAVQLDVSDAEAVQNVIASTVRRLGGIGVVVHTASPAIHPIEFASLEWDRFAEHLDVGLGGAFRLAKACVPTMQAQGYGRIVVITSGELDGPPTPKWTAYAVGKSALATFARSLAVELGPTGITVNCVSPGMTDTPFIGDLSEKGRLLLARRTPLRRLARSEDVAEAVAFLVSPRADYINGETLRVNGGQFTL